MSRILVASEIPVKGAGLVRFDGWVVAVSLGLVGAGLLGIWSSEVASSRATDHLFRQSAALGLGLVLALILALVPYQVFQAYRSGTYVAAVSVLALVLMAGTGFRGTRGWFEWGPLRLQAAEVARPLVLLSFAAYLDRRIDWQRFSSVLAGMGIVAVPVGLLWLQPDVSGSLVYGPVALAMLYLAGARGSHLVIVVLLAALAGGVPLLGAAARAGVDKESGTALARWVGRVFSGGWAGGAALAAASGAIAGVWWFLRKLMLPLSKTSLVIALAVFWLGAAGGFAIMSHLKDYQRDRLITFVRPSSDPLGSGYQVRQSKIAIGSGRLTGKGFGNTTQVRLGFLPAYHTDFIFSALAEAFGFVGAGLVMALYFLLVWRAFQISAGARDRFGSLAAAGFGVMFAAYGVLNLGMALGVTPVVGVPLPLVSYGGSGLVSHLFAVGILLSVDRHRHIL